MAVTVSFGRLLASSICSIFPQCMESNTLEKFINKSVNSRFLARALDLSVFKMWIDFSENHFDSSQELFQKQSIVNFWKENPVVCGHLSHISENIQIRRTRLAGHRWGSKGEFISDFLIWILSDGQAGVGRC